MTRDDERGAVIVLLAMLMVVIIIVTALVVDVGYASQERRQAQNAADAAALTGAQMISSGATGATALVAAIQTNVASNFGSVAWTGCADPGALAVTPDVANRDTCISFDTAPPLTQHVRVSIPARQVPTGFARIAKLDSITVTASATALASHTATAIPCAFCSLADSDIQNGSINVSGGNLYMGGNVTCNPHGTLTTTGGTNELVGSDGCRGHWSPTPVAVSSIGDPMAAFPASPEGLGVDYAQLRDGGDCNGGLIGPGRYHDINACRLTPGLYVVTGTITAATGAGVTLFFTCGTSASPHACATAGEAGGAVDIAGHNGALDVTSCLPVGPCLENAVGGLVLWFDRHDTGEQGQAITISGTAQLTLVGTVYAASGTIELHGTPSAASGECQSLPGVPQSFCSAFITKGIAFDGQPNLTTNYTPELNVHPPSQPARLSS